MVNAQTSAPAAPRVWPTSDFVALMATWLARRPKRCLIALTSTPSTDRSGGGVRIDVVDLRGPDARIPQRHGHGVRDLQAIVPGHDHVMRLAGRGIAGDLGVDARIPLPGVIQRLED